MTFLEIFFTVFAFIFGTVWGSFLNVVIYRLPNGLSLVKPPSSCPKCKQFIKPWHNIPIFGYMIIGGKCASCREPVSIRYPLVELVCAAMSVAVWFSVAYNPLVPGLATALSLYAFRFFLILALIAITFIDLEFMLIPDVLSLPFIAFGLAMNWFFPNQTLVPILDALIGMGAGAGLILALIFGYKLATGKEGMGFGDAKLMAVLGAYLGWKALPFIFLAGSLQGLLYAGGLMIAGNIKGSPWKQALPFGPFLALAGMEWLFFSETLGRWLWGLFGLG